MSIMDNKKMSGMGLFIVCLGGVEEFIGLGNKSVNRNSYIQKSDADKQPF